MAKEQMMARVLNEGDELFHDFVGGVAYILAPGAEGYWPVDIAKFFIGDWDLLKDEKAKDKDKRFETKRVLLRMPEDKRAAGVRLKVLDIFDAQQKVADEVAASPVKMPVIAIQEDPEFEDLLEKPAGEDD